jgi:2,4-dienoyl-CoA reductase-like NADH-dependent reductase (Old Yellow Enzyme family)
MIEYYTQRATAGLIISEGIPVVPQGVGYANVPGIWSPQQTEAWMLVTESVHEQEAESSHSYGMWAASQIRAFWRANFRLLPAPSRLPAM